MLDIWEWDSCRALLFTGHILYNCSENVVVSTTGQCDVSLGNALNLINAWLV